MIIWNNVLLARRVIKNCFRLRLNNEIETLQLTLREKVFQILTLKLLKVFESRGNLRSWHPRVLCSWILSLLISIIELYILVRDDQNIYTLLIQLYEKIFFLEEDLP